ncbi:MAG: hypothetical protein IKZ87_01385 [Actinomycetaceae bacterium]|nr:hypothetical protein [Actinomycetaceae bacterium]
MTTQVLTAEAASTRPVIAWYRNGAKRDSDFYYHSVWESLPDRSTVTSECKEHVDELRDRAAKLRGVRGEGLARKRVAKALEELEDRFNAIKRATNRYGMALCVRNFFNSYENYLLAAA